MSSREFLIAGCLFFISIQIGLAFEGYSRDQNETSLFPFSKVLRRYSANFENNVVNSSDTGRYSHSGARYGMLAAEPSSVNKNYNTPKRSLGDEINLFNLVSVYAPVSPNVKNEICRQQSLYYIQQLNNFTLWASQMFDASTKFPGGVLVGSTYDLGNFDECVQVDVGSGSERIRGQYCLASVTFTPKTKLNIPKYQHSDKNMNVSTWNRILSFSRDPSKRVRNEIHFAMCIPSSCTADDLQVHLSNVIEVVSQGYNLDSVVNVEPNMCQIYQPLTLSIGDIIILLVAGIFCMVIGLSTSYDLITKIKKFKHCQVTGMKHDLIMAFSASSNLLKLINHTPSDDGLDCIHGMKFVSICLIIMGHRLMFCLGSPIINTDFVERFYYKVEAMILLNGPIIVDTFFNISGFLVCYLLLQNLKKNGTFNIPLLYFHRYVRLTPVYLMVLGFYSTLLVKVGDGPLWFEKIGAESERCHASWWVNALYINNYVQPEKLCMIQSWYITCDMHLFLISPFVVYLLYKKPKIGKTVLLCLTITSIIVAFSVTYVKKLDALLLLYIKTLRDPIANPTFRNMYIPTHTRASPYFVGMATGYIKYKLTHTGAKIPKIIVWIGWIVAFIFIEGTVFSAWLFYAPDNSYNPMTSAVYGALHRITWSLGTSWMILAMSTGNGAFIEPIFSWRPLVTLSRLSYCAFLTHGGLQLYSVAAARTPFYGSIFNLIWLSLGDITMSFLSALGLTLSFESPILGLEKILLRKKSTRFDLSPSSSNPPMPEVKELTYCKSCTAGMKNDFNLNVPKFYPKVNF